MNKIIEFNEEAKEKLKKGAEKVYKAVSVTMGPWGRNVLLEKDHGQVSSTKDGVTVAKNISLEDPIENMGATIIKQASMKTVETAGDGTTTSTVLAYSIINQALNITKDNKINVTKVKKGIEEATKEVINSLKDMSKDIEDENQLKQIATLSANGDEEIGNLVSMALDKSGKDGIVTVEKSRSGETYLEVVEGLQFDRGYKTPYFITDNNNMSCVLNNPYILIYNNKISAVKDILPLLEKVSSENKSLLIIADDIEGEALATLAMNKGRGVLQVCAVKAPEFGERKTQAMEDIAVLTGATVVSDEAGRFLHSLDINWLGSARVVTCSKETTTIVDGKGNEDKIKERIESLKNLIENTHTPYEVEKLQMRLGKLVGGVVILNVGGVNEIDMEERKDRVEDALQATKSAIEEGILPGAGVALLNARNKINHLDPSNPIEIGKNIIYTACLSPLTQILSNAGREDIDYWINYLEKSDDKNIVPNINENTFSDYLESGIIDPTKVVRTALENAAGAAITLLLTECVIYSKPDEKNNSSFGMSEFGM